MKTTHISLAVVTALALAACASPDREDPSLTQAHIFVNQAEASPAVNQYSPDELALAKRYMSSAEAAAHNGDHGEADYQAYLAGGHARLAMVQAREKTYEAHVDTRAAAPPVAVAVPGGAVAVQPSADAETARLRNDLSGFAATDPGLGTVVTLRDVMFAPGKVQLQPDALAALDKVASVLDQYPDRRVRVEGFADAEEGDTDGTTLSLRRANAVRDALISRGVAASRIDTLGYGDRYPVASNDSSEGRQLNRRVEIIIGNSDGEVPARGLVGQR